MKSNCILYALKKAFSKAEAGKERYLVIRISRIDWGFFHMMFGKLDPNTNQIAITSYKPPEGHVKTKVALTFHGAVVEGDKPPVRTRN